jgi:hypothetical protein
METFAYWSFWIIIVLEIMGLGIIMSKHGEPKTGKYNFWFSVTLGVWQMWVFWFFFTH